MISFLKGTDIMNVYFFSRHEAQEAMVADLGGKIDAQFRGTISNIKRKDGTVSFDEVPLGESSPITHHIPENSIIVAVCPLPLQQAWLQAGVTLLLPQNRRETTSSGEVVFNYAGLLRVKKICVETEQWAGATPTVEQKHSERSAL